MRVAVLGSGAGALAVAADMSRHGRHTVMADFDDFRADLDPVAETGGVTVSIDGNGPVTHPVATAGSVGEALDGAELAILAVPCSAHERWVQAIAPHTNPDQTVLFVGEGGGAIAARRVIELPTTIAETNTLPLLARLTGPGEVSAFRKLGGVLIAALPPTPPDKARVMELIGDVWPYVTATDTVWTTVLTSYDAIDRAATTIANAGILEIRTGGMLLRGEGATPAVLNVIEAADAELLALRRALNSNEPRRYQDLLVAQGFAPDLGPDSTLFDTVRACKPAAGYVAPNPGNTGGLNSNSGYITEDMPCTLMLASSLGQAAGVPTPVIDGLVAAVSAMLGQDFRAEGRTLAALGLGGLDVTGLVGFARSGMFP